MRRFKALLTVLLALLLLFDGITAIRLGWYGLPKNISMVGERDTKCVFRAMLISVPG